MQMRIWLRGLFEDTRAALRSAKRDRRFSAIVLLTTALAIGLSTALLSLLNVLVLRPLDIPAAGRVVTATIVDTRGTRGLIPWSVGAELGRVSQSFELFVRYTGGGLLRIDQPDGPVPVVIEAADADYFELLGATPFLGRLITAGDVPADRRLVPVIVLAHRFWQRQFGGDPAIVGESLVVRGIPVTVVGIAPPGLTGLRVEREPDVFLPLGYLQAMLGPSVEREAGVERLVWRLRPGVPIGQARAELEAIWPGIRLGSAPPASNPDARRAYLAREIRVESLATGISHARDLYGSALSSLAALAGVLLTTTAVSLGGLMVARQAARRGDLTVRLALGASPARLVQQRLVESVIYAFAGFAMALPVAWWSAGAFGRALAGTATVAFTPDGRVMAGMSAATLLLGAAVALWPAVTTVGTGRQVPLYTRDRRVSRGTSRFSRGLLAIQIALACTLLYSAGLFAHTLWSIDRLDLGFRTANIVHGRFLPLPNGYQDLDEAAHYPALLQRLEALPGAEGVAFSNVLPNPLVNEQLVGVAGTDPADSGIASAMDVVSPRFFEVLDIPIRAGRAFTWLDTRDTRPVAIVSQGLADRLFPAGEALGRRIRIGLSESLRSVEIVGIAGDIRTGEIRSVPMPSVYRPSLQEPQRLRTPIFFIRGNPNLPDLHAGPRRIAADMGREYVSSTESLADRFRRDRQREHLAMHLATAFSIEALVLTTIGLFALLATSVARRTREFGIRLAVGADRRELMRLVLLDGLRTALSGLVIGIAGAWVVGRMVAALLFETTPWHTPILIGVAATVVAVSVIAGAIPARQASKLDPLVALRSE